MTFEAKERDLMLEALDRGEGVFVKVYGSKSRMRRSEKDAARLILQTGKDVPVMLLRMVCMGLEYLYFCENRQGEGIAPLLARLESICGYKRFGMAMLDARAQA